ncbi:MAG: hypothetical protein ACRYF0_10175, partial [Janthinobacterium lividum]
MASQTGFVGPEVAQDSLLVQTSFQTVVPNVGDDPQKKIGERFAGEGLSEVQVLDDTASPNGEHPAPGAASKEKVARKRK